MLASYNAIESTNLLVSLAELVASKPSRLYFVMPRLPTTGRRNRKPAPRMHVACARARACACIDGAVRKSIMSARLLLKYIYIFLDINALR